LKESYESKSQQQTAIKSVTGPWISTSCHPHRSPQEDTNSKQTKTTGRYKQQTNKNNHLLGTIIKIFAGEFLVDLSMQTYSPLVL